MGLSPKIKLILAEHLDMPSTYPDRECTDLSNVLSSYCSIPANYILPGNSSSELIGLLIDTLAPEHTLILEPPYYSEYSRELFFPEAHRRTIT